MKRYQLNANKYLSPDERRHLHRTLRTQPPSDRDRLLIEFALSTGARANEVLGLQKEDLIKGNKSVYVRALKGSNDREIPLRPNLFLYLWRHAQKSETQFVFDIGYHRFRQIWDWYRPAAKPLHCLRHTFAIELYAKTKDLRLVQFALGHRSVTNTMIYAHYHYAQTELRRAFFNTSVSSRDENSDTWPVE